MLSPKQIIEDVVSLLYPRLCLMCQAQVQQDDHICLSCETELPRTDYHSLAENPITEKFYGRLNLRFGAAYLIFSPGNKTQDLIHALKYQDKPILGQIFGKEYGQLIQQSSVCPKADCLIPVPLHPRKQHLRGYNQSEWIARGLSEGMGIPVDNQTLIRSKFTETQTRKSRMSRLNNMESAFSVSHPEDFKYKHAIIVDDVLTTGATLESCALTLRSAFPDLDISFVTLAIGE